MLKSFISSRVKSALGRSLHEKLVMSPRIGYWPQIECPRSFNEKIMHRKLYTDNNIFGQLTDKAKVRNYVRKTISSEYLNELYCILDNPNSLDLNKLPESFVIKTGSKGAIIVDNKKSVSTENIKKTCKEKIKKDYGVDKGEYWYEDTKSRILIEKRLYDDDWGVPLDYKFFVFHGSVEVIEVDFNRFSGHRRSMYTPDWNRAGFTYEYPSGPEIQSPENLEEMIEVAEQLGNGFNFVRVDLYSPNQNTVVFGEMTFAPEGGGGRFEPKEYDFLLGNMW